MFYDDAALFGNEGFGHGKGLPPGWGLGKGGYKGEKGDEERLSNVGSQGSQQNIITNYYYGSGGNSEIDKKRDAKLLKLIGNDGSALELAKQMSESEGADIAQLKVDASLGSFPMETNCVDDLWNLLWAETLNAGEQNRHPFVFVSLTANEILPEWLGPESVGGKTTNGSEISGLESEALEKLATDLIL